MEFSLALMSVDPTLNSLLSKMHTPGAREAWWKEKKVSEIHIWVNCRDTVDSAHRQRCGPAADTELQARGDHENTQLLLIRRHPGDNLGSTKKRRFEPILPGS